MSTKNKNIIEKVSPSGLKWSIDKRVANDWRLLDMTRELMAFDREDTSSENITKFYDKIREIFIFILTGKIITDLDSEEDKNEAKALFNRFMNLIAQAHGGFATPEAVFAEFSFMLESIGIKNSKASHT